MTSKQRKIFSILLLAIGIFVFISLITHNETDIGTIDEQIQNFGGKVGSLISYYSYNFTIGYPVLVLPLLMIAFGVLFFAAKITERFWSVASQVLVFALVVSMVLAFVLAPAYQDEVHGILGHFLVDFTKAHLGGAGTIIIIVTLGLTNTIWAFDPKIFNFEGDFDFSRFKNWLPKFEKKQSYKVEEEAGKSEEFEITKPKKEPEQPKKHNFERVIVPDEKPIKPKVIEEPLPKTERPKPLQKFVYEKQVELQPKFEKPEETPVLPKQPVVQETEEFEENFEEDFAKDEFDQIAIKEEFEEEEANFDELTAQESTREYEFPSIELLDSIPEPKISDEDREEEIRKRAKTLVNCLETFGVKVSVTQAHPGPVITLFEVRPAPGVKIQKVLSLQDDLALAMEARGIRIIAPIPGKSAMGIEIPNIDRSIVSLKATMNTKKFKDNLSNLRIAFGKTIAGEAFFADVTQMPHLLIAGATGTGKSVCMNIILTSILYQSHPDDVKLVLIDPKKVEFSIYKPIKHQFLASVQGLNEDVITKPENAILILNCAVLEMERRYEILSKVGARNLTDYNVRLQNGQVKKHGLPEEKLPYLVVIIDELADLMMTGGKEVEEPIIRLAQMARAVGIHLIIATQRPSVNVITGLIKANFPTRIAFRVASRIDARTIMDVQGGAEMLLGKGDMLFSKAEWPKPERIQCAYVSTEEVERLVNHISNQGKFKPFVLPSSKEKSEEGFTITKDGKDPLYKDACWTVAGEEKISISMIQRKLKIGFNRAANLVDELEKDGIIGTATDGKTKIPLISVNDLNNLSL